MKLLFLYVAICLLGIFMAALIAWQIFGYEPLDIFIDGWQDENTTLFYFIVIIIGAASLLELIFKRKKISNASALGNFSVIVPFWFFLYLVCKEHGVSKYLLNLFES